MSLNGFPKLKAAFGSLIIPEGRFLAEGLKIMSKSKARSLKSFSMLVDLSEIRNHKVVVKGIA